MRRKKYVDAAPSKLKISINSNLKKKKKKHSSRYTTSKAFKEEKRIMKSCLLPRLDNQQTLSHRVKPQMAARMGLFMSCVVQFWGEY